MRKVLVLLVFVAGCLNGYSQQKSKLVGQWKVIGLQNDMMYVNFKTDSLYVDTSIENDPGDEMIEMYRGLFGRWQYCFLKNGQYAMLEGDASVLATGTYKANRENKVIQIRFIKEGETKTINYTWALNSDGNLLLRNAEKEGFTLVMQKVAQRNSI
ncbi:MAG: hypothetical protein ABW174_15285 [Flavitalea sp.]